MKNKQGILQITGIFLFSYLFLLSATYRLNDYQPLYTITYGLLIYFLCKSLVKLSEKTAKKMIISLLIIGGTIRFLWAVFIPTLPVSDFLYYHNYATGLSQNGFTAPLGKNFGFTTILSLGYRIYPALISAKLINALASTLSLCLITLMAFKLIGVTGGIIAALLFAFLPSEINMVSVIGTEVMTTTVMVAIAYFLLRGFKTEMTLKNMLFAGILFGIGLTIRSSLLFYFLACALYLFILPAIKFYQYQKDKLYLLFLTGIISIWLVIIVLHSIFIGKFSFSPFKADESYVYLSGTNKASSGMWNQADANLYFSWPANQRNKLAQQEAIKRIKTDFGGFLYLIPRKFSRLFENNIYGSLWSIQYIDWEKWSKYSFLKEGLILKINDLASQIMYIFALFIAAWSFCKKPVHIVPITALTVVILTMAPHILLEVQSRYHHSIMPFIILAASYGLSELIKKPDLPPAEADIPALEE